MKKINEILEASNFWNKDLFIGNPRSQHINEILELLKLNKCVVLSGPRYSGKSIIVRQVFKTLIDSGVPNVNFLHINLEDPRLEKPLTTKVIFEIIKSYEAKLNPKGEIYITLDEIQSFPDWQKFTKTILQRSTSYKLILTTSSMLDSSRFFEKNQDKFSEHKIGPLSFMEFLDWKEVKSFHATENELTEYLKFGGFPKVVLESNLDIKEEILLGYYQRTIERDLALAFGIRSYNDINRLIDFVMSHTSESISTYEIEKTLKILNVTARNFIKNLKDCHLVSELSFFSESAKQRIYNPEKLFICDTGFVNIMSDQVSNLSVARSAIFEKLKYLNNNKIYYTRVKSEIDFVVCEDGEPVDFINVIEDADDLTQLAAASKSLKAILKKYPKSSAMIVAIRKEEANSELRILSLLEFLTL